MQGVHLRKYGVEAKIDFELYEVDGVDFRVDAVHAAGDTKIMKNEGAEANTTNGFVDEGKGYSITLTAAEMQAARILIYVVDQGTKAWLDKSISIETYGHASAQHAFDLGTALASQTVGTCTTNTDLVTAAAIKTAIEAAGSSLAQILEDTGTTLDALIKDIPTVAEFEARSDPAGTACTPAEVATALTTYDGPTKAEMDAAHALLATPAQVNAQVVDALNVDTYAEPGQEAPPATASLVKKIGYLYKFLRNKLTNDGTTIKAYNDAGDTVDHKATVSKVDSTVTRDKFGKGP